MDISKCVVNFRSHWTSKRCQVRAWYIWNWVNSASTEITLPMDSRAHAPASQTVVERGTGSFVVQRSRNSKALLLGGATDRGCLVLHRWNGSHTTKVGIVVAWLRLVRLARNSKSVRFPEAVFHQLLIARKDAMVCNGRIVNATVAIIHPLELGFVGMGSHRPLHRLHGATWDNAGIMVSHTGADGSKCKRVSALHRTWRDAATAVRMRRADGRMPTAS